MLGRCWYPATLQEAILDCRLGEADQGRGSSSTFTALQLCKERAPPIKPAQHCSSTAERLSCTASRMQRIPRHWANNFSVVYRSPKRRTALIVAACLGVVTPWIIAGGAAGISVRSPFEQLYWAAYSRIWVMNDDQLQQPGIQTSAPGGLPSASPMPCKLILHPAYMMAYVANIIDLHGPTSCLVSSDCLSAWQAAMCTVPVMSAEGMQETRTMPL